MVNWACQLNDDDLTQYKYRLSDPAKEVPLMSFSSSAEAVGPITAHYEKKLFGKAYKDCK